MDKNYFYKELYEEIEIESVPNIDDETVFKELDEWDSMTSMVIIGFLNQNFKTIITADDLENNTTFGNLLVSKGIILD